MIYLIPLGKDTRQLRRCRGTDRTGIARSARIHHSGIHLRQQRKEIYPHLALLQGRQTGGSVETHQRNEINHYRKTAY